jgi:outer membrane protein
MRRACFTSILVIGLLPQPSFAAKILSWQDCVRLAMEGNADLKANIASMNSTQALEGVAKSGYFPQITAGMGYTRETPSTYDITQSPYDAFDSCSSVIKLNQNLFNGMQDIEKLRQAKANTAAARAGLQIEKAQVSFNLKSAYEGYIYAKDFQRLTADIIHRRFENLRIVELRFESGRENKGSVMLSQANLNQAKFDDLQAKDLKEIAKTQLRKALGLEEAEDIEVSEEIPTKAWSMTHPNFSKLADLAPDFQQAVFYDEANQHAISVVRGTFFPQLTFNSEYGTGGGDFYPHVQHWVVGLNVNISLLNGGKDYSNLRSAVYAQSQTENQRISTNQGDVVNLRQAYINLIESIEKLKVDLSYRAAEEIRAEVARRKYNNGLLSFEDWDIIEDDLITRQKNYLTSMQNRVISEASWEQAQGVGAIP